MSLAASVCICTYNGAGRIGDVLEALEAQTLPKELWEVVVIDNASTDRTGAVARRFFQESPFFHGRVLREEVPGQSSARRRAALESKGEILCFLDDDNIPAPDFVAAAVQAFAARPSVGALGGKVVPVWAKPPTPLALAVQGFVLAICDRGDQAFAYEAKLGPVGAGLCIRAELLRRIYREEEAVAAVPGRKGNDCGGADDLAIAILVWRMGFERRYEPSLSVSHLLPESRMHKDYLLRLYAATGRGQAAVRRIFDWKARTPLALVIALKDSLRLLRRSLGPPGDPTGTESEELLKDLNDLEKCLLFARSRRTLAFWR